MWAPSGGTVPAAHTASFSADAPAKVKADKKLTVTLRCLGDLPCVVTYGATLKVPGKGKPQKFTVKGKTVNLAGLTSQQISLKVPRKAKAAVAAAAEGRQETEVAGLRRRASDRRLRDPEPHAEGDRHLLRNTP